MKNIAVIGAGTMGSGIAHLFAQYGFLVSVIDVNVGQLQNVKSIIAKNMDRQIAKSIITEADKASALASISTYSSLAEGIQSSTHLVVEAATENELIKLKIFKELNEYVSPSCILASNTSSISITKIAAATTNPKNVIGMHFMNPVPVMKLVEIINGYDTSQATTNSIALLAAQLGKTPCIVNDYPGFVANRILMPMINEAIFTLYENVAGVQEIDTIMKLGMAHPMGPLQLADFIGLDVCLSILKVLQNGFGNPKYAPCPLLVNMVSAGMLGVKTGEGFYSYTLGSKDAVVSKRFSVK